MFKLTVSYRGNNPEIQLTTPQDRIKTDGQVVPGGPYILAVGTCAFGRAAARYLNRRLEQYPQDDNELYAELAAEGDSSIATPHGRLSYAHDHEGTTYRLFDSQTTGQFVLEKLTLRGDPDKYLSGVEGSGYTSLKILNQLGSLALDPRSFFAWVDDLYLKNKADQRRIVRRHVARLIHKPDIKLQENFQQLVTDTAERARQVDPGLARAFEELADLVDMVGLTIEEDDRVQTN